MRPSPDAVFRSLADPTRRGLFERLCRDGEQNVRRLTEGAGISQPAVSKHLAVLRQAGLVQERREGRETHYRARPRALAPLVGWMRLHATLWHDRIDALEALLDRMDT